MKKLLLLILPIMIILSGCETPREKNEKECSYKGSGYIYSNWCMTKFDYCLRQCSIFISNTFDGINDTRGNKGGFPEAITNSLDSCKNDCLLNIKSI